MTNAEPYRNRIELLQGTLDMLVLQSLQWGPMHGYGIAQAIRLKSSEVLQVETGSLYPALHRLERRGWIKAKWAMSENSRRAKYYELTAKGRKQLALEASEWNRLAGAVSEILGVV
jgi:transcriptional regulator